MEWHFAQVDLHLVVEGDVCELLPPGAVDLVGEAGVLAVQLRAVGQDLVGEPVQVLDMGVGLVGYGCNLDLAGEPGYGVLVVLVEAGDDLAVARGLLYLGEGALHLPGVLVQLHQELEAGEPRGGARLDVDQVDLSQGDQGWGSVTLYFWKILRDSASAPISSFIE